MLEPFHVVTAAVLIAGMVVVLCVFFIKAHTQAERRSVALSESLRQASEDLEALRQGHAELVTELAVERQKSSRLPILEQELEHHRERGEAEREARAEVERLLATTTEARLRLEAMLLETREESAARAHSRETALEQLERSRDERARLETALGEKTALLAEKIAAMESLRKQQVELVTALDARQSERGQLERELSALQETLEQERKQAGEKLRLLQEAREAMTKEFRILANEVMTRHGESFSKQNKEQIDLVLSPLRDKLTEFQAGLRLAHTDSAKERATLGEQIRHLSEASARMTTETTNLTRALKGKAQTQGAWGEMILSTILQRSGLREGEEYRTQTSRTTDEGQRLRPDVIVQLPGSQQLIIDAKVSLVAFEAYVNAESEEERAAHLTRHLASVRAHITSLSGKAYQMAGSSLDYVIMFMPIEGALAAALERDPGLTGFAVQNNVAIATPTTLMIALRTVDSVWQVERRNRNAEKIADRAGRLYDKFAGFVGDLEDIGKRLGSTQAAYQAAFNKLTSGQGNLLRQVENLKTIGAKTSKSLPAGLLGDDEGSSQELDGPAVGAAQPLVAAAARQVAPA